MKRLAISALLILFTVGVCPSALAQPTSEKLGICAKIYRASVTYVSEFKSMKPLGLRLLLKPYGPESFFPKTTADRSKWSIWMERVDWISSLPYDWLVKRPMGWLTQKTLGARYALSRFVLIPSSIFVYQKLVDAPFQAAIGARVENVIQKHSADLEAAIQNDYRFSSLQEDLLRSGGDSTLRSIAMSEAYILQNAYAEYYQFLSGTILQIRNEKPSLDSIAFSQELRTRLTSEETWQNLKDFVLFSDLKVLIENGIRADAIEGFSVPPRLVGKALLPQARADLIMIHHHLLVKYEMIREAFSDSVHLLTDPVKIAELNQIRNDPFTKALLTQMEDLGVDPKRIVYYLQEDAYWQSQFKIWSALGVTRLRTSLNGFSEEPLTIEMIREETLEQMQK